MSNKEKYLKEALKRVFSAKGYYFIEEPDSSNEKLRPDISVEKSTELFAAEINVCLPFRQQVFRGDLADSILKLRECCKDELLKQRYNVFPLVVFLVQSVSQKVLQVLNEYANLYAPDLCWLVVDVSGRYQLNLRGEREEGRLEGLIMNVADYPAQKKKKGPDLFAPKSQWLWKVLLLQGFDAKYWNGPSVSPYSVNEIAEASGVSQPYVSKFLKRAQDEGFIVFKHGKYAVKNYRPLLANWASALQYRSKDEIVEVKPLYPGISRQRFEEQLKKRLTAANAEPGKNFEVLAASHFACKILKSAYTSIQSIQLTMQGSIEAFLEYFDLARCDKKSEPSAAVVVPEAKDSVFNGYGIVDDVPVTDIIQCYLDVRASQSRGIEQSDYLFENIIKALLKAH